ncbi:hypothetical protein QCN29_20580 [Streptomyces sp. HNM0663]|uniref:Uncharacterized protein n=1 Tax=Streptomyces chengmaiensis TaxID=3040919 RepID=A0ABT6HS51_9ACTN|nr:DUF6256 family protein [Streptomyces chengmaiensis]MDH2391142.1 hypothetical protein [Streptomyces chengmaiensis]
MLPTALNATIMLAGYLLVIGSLALGLRILRRSPPPPEDSARRSDGRLAAQLARATVARRGRAGLICQVAGTAVGGYVLLMAVVVGYYYGVAGLSGKFVMSAVTGSASLVGLAAPVFAALTLLSERRRGRHGRR